MNIISEPWFFSVCVVNILQSSHWSRAEQVSSPDPTHAERVWWYPTDPLGFINVDCCLRVIFQPPIIIAESTICGCNTGSSWLLQLSTMTQQFFDMSISYQFATIHKVSYEFLVKPEESVRCHQTLSSWAWRGVWKFLTTKSESPWRGVWKSLTTSLKVPNDESESLWWGVWKSLTTSLKALDNESESPWRVWKFLTTSLKVPDNKCKSPWRRVWKSMTTSLKVPDIESESPWWRLEHSFESYFPSSNW